MHRREYIAIAWGVNEHAEFAALLGVLGEVEVKCLGLAAGLRGVCCLVAHVECINQRAFADVGASHDEDLLCSRVTIVEVVVIFFDALHEGVDVPLV